MREREREREGSGTDQITNDVERQVIEPMQTVHLDPFAVSVSDRVTLAIPLLDQFCERVLDVGFELSDALRTEGVRDGFALSRVLGAVTRVEEASLDGDEGVVVFTGDPAAPERLVGGFLWLLFGRPTSSTIRFHAHTPLQSPPGQQSTHDSAAIAPAGHISDEPRRRRDIVSPVDIGTAARDC